MRLNEVQEIEQYFASNLYEMTNFWPERTGLTNIKMWVREEPKELPHTKYRVKFEHPQKGSAVFALWGDEAQQVAGDWIVAGKELKQIQYLIQNSHNKLRKFIDGEIDVVDMTNHFATIKQDIKRV